METVGLSLGLLLHPDFILRGSVNPGFEERWRLTNLRSHHRHAIYECPRKGLLRKQNPGPETRSFALIRAIRARPCPPPVNRKFPSPY